MAEFDFPKTLEATFRGVIEIIYFYLITILLFILSPLRTWDRIYNEVMKPKSDSDFRNIGLSQPTMFFAISLFIFLFFIKLLFMTNYLQESQLTGGSLIFKFIEKVTNIYELDSFVSLFVLIAANLVFSMLYIWIFDNLHTTLNDRIGNWSVKNLYWFAEKIGGKELKEKHHETGNELYFKMLIVFFKKVNINLEKRQETPFFINWTDTNSIYRFITISNFISGFLLFVFMPASIIVINYPEYSWFAYIVILLVFLLAWVMGNIQFKMAN